jgi:hypothetical protein
VSRVIIPKVDIRLSAYQWEEYQDIRLSGEAGLQSDSLIFWFPSYWSPDFLIYLFCSNPSVQSMIIFEFNLDGYRANSEVVLYKKIFAEESKKSSPPQRFF